MTKTEKETETQQKLIETKNGPEQHKQEKKRETTETKKNTAKTGTCNISNEMLNPAQSKYDVLFCGCMRPDDSISHHPAFPLLFKYAIEGCPVNCGEPWMHEHLEVAIHRGPHISA